MQELGDPPHLICAIVREYTELRARAYDQLRNEYAVEMPDTAEIMRLDEGEARAAVQKWIQEAEVA